ncbi:hypothetical protein ACBI99_44670 [Nonomuraea sp. ATR24]|uniref:hypothetical protein n=1 Tax=Nonomuraea sp. ATR24 TaxID=1676744 RepID=UPI0035BFFF3A
MAVQGYSEADLARLRSVAARPQGWSHRVKPQVTEYRDVVTGHWVKVIRDEYQRVRMRWSGQDAHVILPHLRVNPWVGITEERE